MKAFGFVILIYNFVIIFLLIFLLYVSKPPSLWFVLISQSASFLSGGIILELRYFSSALLSVLWVLLAWVMELTSPKKILIY